MKKIIYTILILNLFSACSTKRSGITNRTYHRITTWYNTVFNGQEALDNDLKAKKMSYQDNFSTVLQVEPINPFSEGDGSMDAFSPQNSERTSLLRDLKGDLKKMDTQGAVNTVSGAIGRALGAGETSQAQGLDRAIEKGKKAIENHSMLIKGKEYNSMLGEAYLLLGRAYYYKKDPFESMNYLNFMNSTLVKNRKENQAKAYIALAQEQAGNSFQANEKYEELLKTKLKKRDKKFVSKIYSQFLINERRYDEAIEALDVAKKYNKGRYYKGRYNFIQGQLSEKLKKEEDAAEYYQAAYKKKPSPELEIKAQIALSRLFKEDTLAYHDRIKFLRKLTKKGLYQSRKNELFYAMALTSLRVDRENDAMKYLQQSLKEKESDPQVRALVFQEVGDIYFSKPDYIYAGAYYDSAVSRFVDPAMKNKLTAKNNSLKEITQKYYLVKKNDSILAIAGMTVEQRNEYYQKHINKLKEEEEKIRVELEKSLREEDYTVFATETLTESVPATRTTSGGKWYFYNNSLKQTGQSEFRRLWGNRDLTDNWRMSRQTSGLDNIKSQLLGQEETKNPRRFEVEYYTEKLPNTQSELEALKIQRDSAELSLGIMYYDRLHDVKSATSTLEHLLSTPPHDEEVSLAAMYNLYKFNKEDNPDLAEKYANLVTTNHPDSKYAKNILNPQVDIFKSRSSEAITFYEEAYKKYEEGNYDEVKEMAAEALEKYPTDEIIAKFSLLSAFCEAKLGDKAAFMEALENVSTVFEDKEEGKKATELLNYFKEYFKEQEKQEAKLEEEKQEVEEKREEFLPSIEEFEKNDSVYEDLPG
ncbi:MAG: hypothetical protein LBQ84_06940 [Flavobacteriaceae bacterium]|jgi:hypothetical protein|nr:hypothetical protein [Flavobacteriaceae bacterium]